MPSKPAEDEDVDMVTEPDEPGPDGSMGDDGFPALESCAPAIIPRSYQLEMLQESIKQNVIVAMDTGSGKTHIAVMRMQHDVEAMAPHQLVWFLAPTVSLCSQQFETIRSQITSVQVKFLSGEDGVDRWTEQGHWDSVLRNVKVVVSTYQILLDALTHGFIHMERLALIVFDEAHNCTKKAAGAKIMHSFYHERRAKGLAVPRILGLTASPVMRSSTSSLVTIEETLNAICRTPHKHHAELRLQVKLPVLQRLGYQSTPSAELLTDYTPPLTALGQAYRSLEITNDPCYLSLRKENTDRSRRALDKVLLSHKTYCQDQMKSLNSMALTICKEAGPWAADYYISQVVSKITQSAAGSSGSLGVWDVPKAEMQYLMRTLRYVAEACINTKFSINFPITDKVEKMMDVLLGEPDSLAGIIFVKERALVSVLAHVLRTHPRTKGKFMIGTMVGSSVHSQRTQNVGELIDIEGQKNTIARFKTGEINLVIATSVLEEGIDVSACNLVLCFEQPANLKSFVQRRGRARQAESKLILLLDSVDGYLIEWESLEEDMRRVYEDDMRVLQELLMSEETEAHDARSFRVKGTNALLDLDNAVAHLYHFCSTLPAAEYVHLRPDFLCSDIGGGMTRCKVILPLSVNEAVRTAESLTAWKSEKNAIKDASFQAYLALYQAGLLSDNLLPLARKHRGMSNNADYSSSGQAAIMTVREQLDPWIDISKAWNEDPSHVFECAVTFNGTKLTMVLPVPIPHIPASNIYWDSDPKNDFYVTFVPNSIPVNKTVAQKALKDTQILLETVFGYRFPTLRNKKETLVMRFFADQKLASGHECVGQSKLSSKSGLIRHIRDTEGRRQEKLYVYKSRLSGKPPRESVRDPYDGFDDIPQITPHLSLERFSKRADFLHKSTDLVQQSQKVHAEVLPADCCMVDNLPVEFAYAGLLIPSLTHIVEIYLVAETLSRTILEDVEFSDSGLSLIVTAISASESRGGTNYQRQEYLGDSLLKLITSVQLMAQYPMHHQGLLTRHKSDLVSNHTLYKAALKVGLDKFIITKAFTGKKWRPGYVEEISKASTDQVRQMSSKVLADVVEALIYAAMADGCLEIGPDGLEQGRVRGLQKCLACLQAFLPEPTQRILLPSDAPTIRWNSLGVGNLSLFDRFAQADDIPLPSTFHTLEALVGYKFQKPAILVEAMTHTSAISTAIGDQNSFASYDRLEFLGDAILDHIVVEAMAELRPDMTHIQLHLYKTALVNRYLLAFLCMQYCVLENAPVKDPLLSHQQQPQVERHLWQFMRHSANQQFSADQKVVLNRYARLRSQIQTALESGTQHPWSLLCQIEAPKFYSDLIESIIGALWIDSGSFDACREFVSRLGILKCLDRAWAGHVNMWHPKEELGVMGDQQKVTYQTIKVERPAWNGELELVCTVSIGENAFCEVPAGRGIKTIYTAETIAAAKAIEMLKGAQLMNDTMDLDACVNDDGIADASVGSDVTADAVANIVTGLDMSMELDANIGGLVASMEDRPVAGLDMSMQLDVTIGGPMAAVEDRPVAALAERWTEVAGKAIDLRKSKKFVLQEARVC